jgi:hypothetical protein
MAEKYWVDVLSDALAKILPSNEECRKINLRVVNGEKCTRREKIIAEAYRVLNSGGSSRIYESLIRDLGGQLPSRTGTIGRDTKALDSAKHARLHRALDAVMDARGR